MNPGKRFETDWKNSVPSDVYYERLKDPAQSFSPSENLRFSPKNPYDHILYRYPIFMAMELKTTKNASMTYWREDYGNIKPMIKKEQILGLLRASGYNGCAAGFVLNFRTTLHTYYLDVRQFVAYTANHNRKSINEEDVIRAGGMLIGQKKLKVNYRYDIGGLIDVIGARCGPHSNRTDSPCDRGRAEAVKATGRTTA